jgi:hypothetical protein
MVAWFPEKFGNLGVRGGQEMHERSRSDAPWSKIGLSANKTVDAFLKKAAQKTFSQLGLWRCHQHGPV